MKTTDLKPLGVVRQLNLGEGNWGVPGVALESTIVYVTPDEGLEFQILGVRTGNEPFEIILTEAKVEDEFVFKSQSPIDIGVAFKMEPYFPFKTGWISSEKPLELYVNIIGSPSVFPILSLVFLGNERGTTDTKKRLRKTGTLDIREFTPWLEAYCQEKNRSKDKILDPIHAFLMGDVPPAAASTRTIQESVTQRKKSK